MFDVTSMMIFGALTLAAALGTDRFRLAHRIRHLRNRQERLGDEIWEVRDAVEARRRAEAASEAKSRFLANVSHEVRTPLNGILGIAELLTGTPLDREQMAYVEAVKTSGRALATLIDEILDFSRIEAGRLELQSECFELAAVVEGVVELLAPRAQDKGLEIACFFEPGLPACVIGDPVRLRQILTNLAGNAVKFTERGGVGVSISRTGGGAIRFAVEDTGPGVPPDRREAIFQEFEQGDGTSTRRQGGSGLGLAISKRIVEGMGGQLVLESRPGGGSIFACAIDLPAAAGWESSTGAPATPMPWPDLNARHALIVANSPFQAPFLGHRLRAAGAIVTIVTRIEEALPHFERRPAPYLLFVDCALGQRTAEWLADAARATGVTRAFLLFSPFERRAFGQSLTSGFDGWLVKPVRAASLAARLGGAGETMAFGDAGSPPRAIAEPRTLRVLLAEDNEVNTLVAMNFLGRLGAQVVHAANGYAALDLALSAMRGESPAFDAILMDISMPELDGIEVTRRIRLAEAGCRAPRLRIVALTAHAFAEDREACLKGGIDEVLTKPVDFARLAAVLQPRTTLKATG